jgi:hypothetical protein
MKKYFVIVALLLSVLFLSCKKDNGSGQCTASPVADTAPANGTVMYSATVSGGGKLISVTYQDAGGPVTVNNPTSPWHISVNVNSGAAINISVKGSGGKITAGYTFSDPGGINPIATQAECN